MCTEMYVLCCSRVAILIVTKCVSAGNAQNIILAANKKLSYCWETVRRKSMPRIAEMDVEMTT